MKYVEAERITAEINKIIEGLKKKSNPNPLGTIDDMLADAEIETLELVKTTIDEMKQEEPTLHGANALIKQIWHKESEHPDNRHPYPVLNPDGEMAYAYYDKLCGWQFDREFKHSANMLWLDIEKILPKKD